MALGGPEPLPASGSSCGYGWGRFPTANARPSLYGLSASSAADVWAAGASSSGAGKVLHFDGVRWESIPSVPVSTRDTFRAVASLGPGNVWVAGYTSAPK